MKHFFYAAIVALVGLTATVPRVEAALSYNNGDLFLGFRASGGTGANTDYLVNIGPASQFTNAAGTFTVNGLGNIGADLAAAFGPNWHTRGDVFWSISGTNVASDPVNTLYATRARMAVGTPALAWLGRSNSTQSVANSKLSGLAGAYKLGDATANSSVGTIQDVAFANSYASYQPGGTAANSAGISFGFFNPSIEASFANGPAASVLDLFKVVPVHDQSARNLGSFTLDATGNLSFSPAPPPVIATVRFEQAQYSVDETDATGKVNVKLVRGGDLAGAFTVEVRTNSGSAVAGTDFTGFINVPVSFAANQSDATVSITVANRAGIQGNRSFGVALSSPSEGANIDTPSSTTVTIVDTNQVSPGVLAFGAVEFTGNSRDAQGNPNSIAVVIDRAEGTTGEVSVGLAVTGGTLTSGTDFEAIPTTVTFANGEATKTVNVQLKSIDTSRLPGTIILGLSNPTGEASIGTQSSATVNVTFTVRPAVAGTYNGLLSPVATGAEARPGFLALTLNAKNAFTGKITVGAYTIAISGTFGADGKAKFKPSQATSLVLVGKGKPPVQLGTLELTIDGDVVSGTIKDAASNVIANIGTERSFFDGKSPATSVDPKFLANKGIYTAVFPARATQIGLETSAYSQGDGFGNVKVTKNGAVTFKGKLADGTAVAASGRLSQDYQWHFFVPLYAKQGSIGGTVTFDTNQTDSDLKGLDLLWRKPANAKSKHYAAGWPAGIRIDLLGASYAVPPKSAPASVLPGLGAVNAQEGNASLVFTDGKLTAPIPKNVSIDTKNKVVSAPTGDKSFNVKITAATGSVSGKFLHTDNTRPAFQGVIFQKGENAGAYGYFLSTVPKGGSGGESGSVTLKAK